VQFTQVVIHPSVGEGETRWWRINEVNNMEENPSCGNWWREESWRDNRGRGGGEITKLDCKLVSKV